MLKYIVTFLSFLGIFSISIAQPRVPEIRPVDDVRFHVYKRSFDIPVGESNIQSSLNRLAQESCRSGNEFRILFYGQSITEQGWWLRLGEYLKIVYPDVKFNIINRAIGGHPADMLLKTAEADIYRFYPDLVIFHAYGSHISYEKLIQNIRERTTADVIIANDHVTNDTQLTEETTYWKLLIWRYTRWFSWYWSDKRQYGWEAWMNYVFLPNLADKYRLELVDMRTEWKKYLSINNLKANQLLIDGVHMNANGEYLMAEIMKPYLAKKSIYGSDCANPNIIEIPATKLLATGDLYQFKVIGNRLEIDFEKQIESDIAVAVNGLPPSQHFNKFVHSRSSVFPGTTWPVLLQVHNGKS